MSSLELLRKAQEEVIAFLMRNPEKAIGPDKPATASLIEGLQCRVTGAVLDLVMDMPKGVGGTATGPAPGTLLRAADAGCLAIVVAMKAARDGVKLTHLEVTVGSQSDDRGLFGIGDAPAGPLSYNVTVKMAGDAPPFRLIEIVHWAEEHSPVSDAIRRAIPTRTDVMIVGTND